MSPTDHFSRPPPLPPYHNRPNPYPHIPDFLELHDHHRPAYRPGHNDPLPEVVTPNNDIPPDFRRFHAGRFYHYPLAPPTPILAPIDRPRPRAPPLPTQHVLEAAAGLNTTNQNPYTLEPTASPPTPILAPIDRPRPPAPTLTTPHALEAAAGLNTNQNPYALRPTDGFNPTQHTPHTLKVSEYPIPFAPTPQPPTADDLLAREAVAADKRRIEAWNRTYGDRYRELADQRAEQVRLLDAWEDQWISTAPVGERPAVQYFGGMLTPEPMPEQAERAERAEQVPYVQQADPRFVALEGEVEQWLRVEAKAKAKGKQRKMKTTHGRHGDEDFTLVLTDSDGFAEHLLRVESGVLPVLFPGLYASASTPLTNLSGTLSSVGPQTLRGRDIEEKSGEERTPADVVVLHALDTERLRHVSDGPRGGVWVMDGEEAEKVLDGLVEMGGGKWMVLGEGIQGCVGRWYAMHGCGDGEGAEEEGEEGQARGRMAEMQRRRGRDDARGHKQRHGHGHGATGGLKGLFGRILG